MGDLLTILNGLGNLFSFNSENSEPDVKKNRKAWIFWKMDKLASRIKKLVDDEKFAVPFFVGETVSNVVLPKLRAERYELEKQLEEWDKIYTELCENEVQP